MDTAKYILTGLICLLIVTVAFILILWKREIITYDCIYYNCTGYDLNNNTNVTAAENKDCLNYTTV